MKKILLAALLAASSASALANPPQPSAGAATVIDLQLGGAAAQQFAFSGVNPNQGPDGNTTGFNTAFLPYASSAQSTWSLIGKGNTDAANGSRDLGTTILTWGYDVVETTVPDPKKPNKTITSSSSGSWWIKSSNTVVLDLAVAIHGGSASGAWLLDNLQLTQDKAADGTFSIRWNNNGGQVPDFSNMTLFARDVAQVTSPVPDPETYAMVFAALGLLFAVRKPRRQQ